MKACGAYIWHPSSMKYLLGKRSEFGDAAGTWCIFGGKIENGESSQIALQRELFEEIGVNVPMLLVNRAPLIHVYEQGFRYETYLLTVPKQFTPILNSEHTEFGWFTKQQIAALRPLHPKFHKTFLEIQDSLE